MESDLCSALRLAAGALCSFRTKFGVELSFSNLCEIYVAYSLGCRCPIEPIQRDSISEARMEPVTK